MSLTRIENKTLTMKAYLARVFQYRGLIATLVKRELKSRYAQTKVGFFWMLIQPIFILSLFTVLFDQLIQLDTAEIPYPVFAFSGMIIWYLFTNIVQSGGNALIANQDLMRKVYFPKLILPLAYTSVAIIESSISFFLLFILMALFEVPLSAPLLFLPLLLFLCILVGFTLALWLAAFTIKRRDLQHFIPYIVNTGIWLTPVFYPVTLIPSKYIAYLYVLNPIASLIAWFRNLLFGSEFQFYYLLPFVVIAVFLVFGLKQFIHKEKDLADFI